MKTNKTRISFMYEGKKYTLEYTADSLKRLNKEGFDFANAEAQILSVPEDMFAGAFIANHNDVPQKKRIEIYHELCEASEDGSEIDKVVAAMMSEAMTELRSHKGNVKWTVEA